MKSKFSTSWKSSKQPRKQRKYLSNSPLHTKHKFLSAILSKSLKEKYGKRNVPIRKGDEVLVMKGSFAKKKAKVSLVLLKNSKVAIEGIQRTKKDGTKINVFFHPSNLRITSLNLDDKRRIKIIQKTKLGKETEKNVSHKIKDN